MVQHDRRGDICVVLHDGPVPVLRGRQEGERMTDWLRCVQPRCGATFASYDEYHVSDFHKPTCRFYLKKVEGERR